MLSKLITDAQRKTEFPSSEQDLREWIEGIANPAKWDYFGLLSKEEVRELELLEYLLNDDRNEIVRYAEWKPQKQN